MDALLICRTCPRDQPSSGEPSVLLAQQMLRTCEQLGVAVLRVNCLGACRQPFSIALDSPGKLRLRFSGLGPTTDTASIETLIAGYRQSATGDPASFEIPAALRPALSAVSPKPQLSPDSSLTLGAAQPADVVRPGIDRRADELPARR